LENEDHAAGEAEGTQSSRKSFFRFYDCHERINAFVIDLRILQGSLRKKCPRIMTTTGDPFRMVCTRAMGILSSAANMKQSLSPPKVHRRIKVS
jgi:hypothetical protein